MVLQRDKQGNPGARLSVLIDRNTRPLLSRFLTDRECRFANEGAQCTIVIAGNTQTYRQIVKAFTYGRSAYIVVKNAAITQMQTDLPLKGFAKDVKS